MNDGTADEFDGVSLIEWSDECRIKLLKEFGCNTDNYDPYKDGDVPKFKDDKPKWF